MSEGKYIIMSVNCHCFTRNLLHLACQPSRGLRRRCLCQVIYHTTPYVRGQDLRGVLGLYFRVHAHC